MLLRSLVMIGRLLLLMLMSILLQCDGRALKRNPVGSRTNDGYSFLSPSYHDEGSDEGSACQQLPPPVLTEILGPAFNPRYMSIEEPPVSDGGGGHGGSGEHPNPAGKRDTEPFPPFYVDDKYSLELSNKPAWEVQHVSESIASTASQPGPARTRRDLFNDMLDDMGRRLRISTEEQQESHDGASSSVRSTRSFGGKGRTRKAGPGGGSPRPWECEAKIRWIDLGHEYFPRFLRTVECTRQKCWYGHYTCQPRSFTVKILRRRTGECAQSDRLRHRIGVEDLPGELRELWVWEERAVNFCCDCAPAF
ncbi:protein trunk [Anopheles aquasalis]|uniref:protein trunk n=1 Tax=Anopheles aquasalis TaxID=42839 RepID=UPI00215A6155|nr:protein trunk [Anopheles aquasalis]